MSFHGDLRRHSGVVIYVHLRPYTSIYVDWRRDWCRSPSPFTSFHVHLRQFRSSIYSHSGDFCHDGQGGVEGWVPVNGGQNQSKTHNPEIDDLLVKKCLTSTFELSVHEFGTILKSDALTFHSASIQTTPVKHCSGRIGETRFWVPKHMNFRKNQT